MSNVSVSMKMTAKQAGSLYMKAVKLEDENKELKSLNKEMRAILEDIDLDDPETEETLGFDFVNNIVKILNKTKGDA